MDGLVLSFDFALQPGLGEFFVAGGKDGLVVAEKFVLRGDVTDGGMESNGVVVLDEAGDEAAGLIDVERGVIGDVRIRENEMPRETESPKLWG